MSEDNLVIFINLEINLEIYEIIFENYFIYLLLNSQINLISDQ